MIEINFLSDKPYLLSLKRQHIGNSKELKLPTCRPMQGIPMRVIFAKVLSASNMAEYDENSDQLKKYYRSTSITQAI